MVIQNSGIHKGGTASVSGREGHLEWVRDLVAPTIRWIAAQDRALIRRALGQDADEVLSDLMASTGELEEAVCRHVEALLPELLQSEVRRVFEDVLSCSGIEVAASGAHGWDVDGVDALGGRSAVAEADKGARAATKTKQEASEGRQPAFEVMLDADRLLVESRPTRTVPSEMESRQGAVEASGDPLYEGTVVLLLEANIGIGQVVQFLRHLCLEPVIRLVTLVSGHEEGVSILSMSSDYVRLSGQGKCPSRPLSYHRTVIRGTCPWCASWAGSWLRRTCGPCSRGCPTPKRLPEWRGPEA